MIGEPVLVIVVAVQPGVWLAGIVCGLVAPIVAWLHAASEEAASKPAA